MACMTCDYWAESCSSCNFDEGGMFECDSCSNDVNGNP